MKDITPNGHVGKRYNSEEDFAAKKDVYPYAHKTTDKGEAYFLAPEYIEARYEARFFEDWQGNKFVGLMELSKLHGIS